MKKTCLILFPVIFFTFLAVLSAQAIPTMSLNVIGSDFGVGDTFNAEVWVDGDGIGQDFLAFGFDVLPLGTYFSYDGYTLGSGFDDVSDPLNPYNVSGWWDLSTPLADDIHLATLSFTALDVGTDTIHVQGLYDGVFYGLFYESDGYDIDALASVTINPTGGTPIPEPSTWLLLVFGMLGIIGVKKKLSW